MTFHIIWHSFIILLDMVYLIINTDLWDTDLRLITYRQLHSQCASESLKCWERDCRKLCLCMFVLFVLDHLLWNCLIHSKAEASAAYGVHKVYGVYCLCVLASCWSLERVLSVWLAVGMAWREGKASVMPWLGFAKGIPLCSSLQLCASCKICKHFRGQKQSRSLKRLKRLKRADQLRL